MELGTARRTITRRQKEIHAAAAAVGITEQAQVDVPIRGRLHDQPWTSRITVEPGGHDSLDMLARMLQAACYVVVAFLSGMRDSEKRAELQRMQRSARPLNDVSAGRRGSVADAGT